MRTILQEEIEETLSLQKCNGDLELRAFQGAMASAHAQSGIGTGIGVGTSSFDERVVHVHFRLNSPS